MKADTLRFDALIDSKVRQAARLLDSHGLDAWLIFGQETGYAVDPVYPLLMGDRDMPGGFLLITRTGRTVAGCGGLDVASPKSTGVWDDVRVVAGDMYAALAEALEDLDPASIAINYAPGMPWADGLTHGRYLTLMERMAGTRFGDRFVSAAAVASELRSVKTAPEVNVIRRAITATDEVFTELRGYLTPGMEGEDIFGFIQRQVRGRGMSLAWSPFTCPVLTIGPAEYMGHTPPPKGVRFERGMLMQVDLGVNLDGYSSDFQRMFYAPLQGETCPPREVQSLFELVRAGIDAMVQAIAPGVPNDYPSSIGFRMLADRGFPMPKYSAGHQLGRACHDGGVGLLSCLRGNPDGHTLKSGNVLTVEGLETRLDRYGWVSLEEDVLVTDTGRELLTTRQTEIILI